MNVMEKRAELYRGAAARYEGRANSVLLRISTANIYLSCGLEEYHHWLLEARLDVSELYGPK